MRKIVQINEIKQVTHDVKCFRIEKPIGYMFTPGQATDVSINRPGMTEQKRPFTFTCLPDETYLEFTIKRYPDHHSVTDQLHQLNPGDELIIEDAWGAIEYKGAGYFIAGGAGITPFISILRMLHQEKASANNKLFFSNKTMADIIYEKELSEILSHEVVFILSRENREGYKYGRIDEAFIRRHVTDFSKHFYLCGPDAMVQEIGEILQKMGASADKLVFEN